jgi:microcystin-dependent protein
MAQPYVGEIRMFAGNFNPAGWMFCDGALLPISENEVLFQLIGTTYGGDGESTFGLPDLRGRIPIHQGNGFILAETGGVEQVTLTVQQIATHSHPFLATNDTATADNPQANLPGTTNVGKKVYAAANSPATPMAPNSIGPTGGSQPHNNLQPFLCINFIISLFGLFPSQT